MAKAKTDLVIVESPAKARTIEKYLGNHYQVVASMGHLRDLPKSTMGVDIDGDFTPQYLPVKDRADVIADLKKRAKVGRHRLSRDRPGPRGRGHFVAPEGAAGSAG